MLQCPSCGRPQEPQLVCRECEAPIPVDLDCFAALGLPRKLIIDQDSLEQRYHALGRKIHPDRFASGSSRLRAASLSGTALLTRSYRTLRDPISRGRYWLELHGEKLSDNNKQVPPELVETVFEVQEQLAEMRESGADGEGSELRCEVENRRAELGEAMDALRENLARNFANWDASNNLTPSHCEELTKELKVTLSKIAYLHTLIRDVDRELEGTRAV